MSTTRDQAPGTRSVDNRAASSDSGAQNAEAGRITRCAVCKVDLKGRFVYVDEQAQQLFGCPSEELFGKAIADFVDEASRGVINEILARRNHYEIAFDHIHLTIVDPSNITTQTGAVVTLNFNAGNPVNFQFVFSVDTAVSFDPVDDPHAGAYRHLAAYLDGRNIAADWRGYLRQLQTFTGARQTCVYIISADRLEHRASALDTGDGVSSLPSIEEPGAIHTQVAQTGETYDFRDDRSVQRAVELGVSAPNEVVVQLAFEDDQAFLVRVIFASELEDSSIQARADRARFALELTQRFAVGPPRSADDREADNIQFAIGLLDGLGVGALMVDSRGKAVIYNPALARLLEVEEVEVDLTGLANLLSGNDAEATERISSYLHPSLDLRRARGELVRVELPSGRSGLLACMPLSGNLDDFTAFVAVIPGALTADAADALAFGRTAAQRFGRQLEEATQTAGELGQMYYNSMDEDGNARLSHLSVSLQDLGRLTEELTGVLTIASETAGPELTDLNIMLHRIANHINRRHGNQPLRVHSDVMPKISTARRAVTTALEHLLLAIADVADRGAVTVKVRAELVQPSVCRMDVVVDSVLDRENSVFSSGIRAARLLIRSVGGSVSGKSSEKQTSFTLMIPIES